MQRPMQQHSFLSGTRTIVHIVLVLAGFVLGATIGRPGVVEAQRRTAPAEAFKSGGERSEIVLKEIAGILIRLEERVERIESSLEKLVQMEQRE